MKKQKTDINANDIFSFFEKKGKMLDALVISGGEPSLYSTDVLNFALEFKSKFPNKLIKVDTNGSNPDFIKNSIKIFDFIALDFKGFCFEKFSKINKNIFKNSLKYLSLAKNHEIRITMYPEYIKKEDFKLISRFLKEHNLYNVAIQQYKPVDEIKPYPNKLLEEFQKILKNSDLNTTVR